MSDSEEVFNNKWAGRLRRRKIDIKKSEGSKKFAKKSFKKEKNLLKNSSPVKSFASTPPRKKKKVLSPPSSGFVRKCGELVLCD